MIAVPVGRTPRSLLACLLLPLLFAGGCAVQQKSTQTEATEDEAQDEAPRVIVVEPAVQKLFDAAVEMMQAERYKTAISMFDQVVASEQRLASPYVNLAIAHRMTGDMEKARENIDLALKVDRYNPEANNELGLMLRKEGKFDEARAAYSKALQKHPEYLPVIKNLGILCDIYLRDWDCALEQYENYLDLQQDKQVEIWIADLKRRTGG